MLSEMGPRPDHRDMEWGAKTKSQNHHKAGGHGTQYSQTERIYSGFNFLFPKEKNVLFQTCSRYQRINYFSQNQARFYPVSSQENENKLLSDITFP